MRVAAVSDQHGKLSHSIPDDVDGLIVNGDFVPMYSSAEDHRPVQETDWLCRKYKRWLRKQIKRAGLKFVFISFGNHDLFALYPDCLERFLEAMQELEDETGCIVEVMVPDPTGVKGDPVPHCIYEGVKFAFYPYTPTIQDRNWAFSMRRSSPSVNHAVACIEHDTDVLVTHGPPYGTLDLASSTINGHVGCVPLFHRIAEVGPQVVLSGHVHEQRGRRQVMLDLWGNKIRAINTCLLDRSYSEKGGKVQTFEVKARP